MKSSQKALIKSGVIFAVVATAAVLLWKFVATKEQLLSGIEYIQSFGYWSIAAYTGLYVVLVSLSFPSSVFNITAGILFTFLEGLAVAYVAGLGAATLTFALSRFLFHDYICKRVKKTDTGQSLLDAAAENGAKLIILLRLNPFIPAVIKSYGLGVTDISIRTYCWATLVGQIPLATMYVYLGWMGGRAMLSENQSLDLKHWVVLGAGIVFSIVTLALSRHYVNKHMNLSPN